MHLPVHKLIVSSLISALLFTSVCFGQTTDRVSVDSLGAEGNGMSYSSSISADGRYVAFESFAFNLVPGDTNQEWDIFVHDRQTGVVERVSEDSQGTGGNGRSDAPSISADGRYVAFMSRADNLVQGDTNMTSDIFVHDRQAGVNKRVSVDSLGAEGNGMSYSSSISAAGRYVAFSSSASNLVLGDTNGFNDIFVHDRETGVTERVNVDSLGAQANHLSSSASISAYGRYVSFASSASNLVQLDGNEVRDIFVYDRKTGVTERVSVDSQNIEGNDTSYTGSISANGRYVAFRSRADNLVLRDTNMTSDIFVHDCQTGVTECVSVPSRGEQGNDMSGLPSISATGRYVSFMSLASNLVPGDMNENWDIFVHDRQIETTERVSINSQGVEGNDQSYWVTSISADGRYVAFDSEASNLVPGDTNGWGDVFVRDRWDGLGANSIYLTGPATSPIGVPLDLEWFTAPSYSEYWLGGSWNLNGSVIGGHTIDLGRMHKWVAGGVNSRKGSESFTSPPIPPAAAGHTIYFELLARDANGIFYDSNSHAVIFM